MLGSYEIRTDLALEAREQFTEKNMEIRGVEVRENYDEEKDIRTTVVKITTTLLELPIFPENIQIKNYVMNIFKPS